MKILLINHFPLKGSGSGVYVKNIAKELVNRGHEVCIIIPENTTKIKELPNIKIHPVYFKNKEEIKGQLDFNFICFDSHPRSNLLFSQATDKQVKQYEEAFRKAIEEEIKEFKPDVIHAGHIWIISSIAVDYNIPVVITCHGSDVMGYNESDRYHYYARKAAQCCKKIIAISNQNKKDLENIYCECKDKIISIHNGYEPTLFYKEELDTKEVLKSFNINKDYDKIVCFVGRLAKNKGVDVLLKSAEIYEKENVLTLIAGGGEEREPLESLKEELGLKNVFFVGDQNQENLRKIYNISDVCAVPSREEAFGLVALESIACGTPVVASNQGGIPDIIREDIGVLVERENVEELGNEIDKILSDKNKFDSEYLQNYAKKNYSQDSLIDKLIKIYEEIKE